MKTKWALLAAFGIAAPAGALDLNPSEIRGKSNKEPVTVLQNRYFLKSYRPEFGLMAGMIVDEAYLNTATFGARAGMFMTEWLGFEVQTLKTKVSDSDDRKALQQKRTIKPDSSGDARPATNEQGELIYVTSDPEVNAVHGMQDFTVVAAPFYGKLNLLNKWIIYTDLYAGGGVSRVETDQGDIMGMTLAIGERFYLGKAWSMRIDIKDRIYTESRSGMETRKNSYAFDLGASYFFN